MFQGFSEIYKNKKVFLTGHTGFKGSWLLSWLHLMGAQVKGYALAPENSFDLYHQIKGDTLCQSVIADIRDSERLKNEIINFQPDFIFHLAAQPLVRMSYELPIDTFAINAMGSAYLLEAVRALAKPCIVVMVTTDKVYQNQEKHYYYKEEDKLGGYDPYSASKAAAEIVINSYKQSFFNPNSYDRHQKSIAVGRAGNVIGGGDWAKDRIIPDIVRALIDDKEIKVRNPAAVRPWQHVLEPLGGYLCLAAHQVQSPTVYADTYNFGPYPTDNLTVKEIAEKAITIWGTGNYTCPPQNNAPHEAGLLQLNIDKAMTQLSWKPKYNAATAIEKTIDWYKANEDKTQDMAAYTKHQILDYQSLPYEI